MKESVTPTRDEVRFWRWFARHEKKLFHFDRGDMEKLFDRLSREMKRVHPALTFEFGPVEDDGRRVFVISAGGLSDAAPAAAGLASCAPELERWEFVAFRQRFSPICTLTVGGREYDPAAMQAALLDEGDKVGLDIFMPGYDASERDGWMQAAFLLLDNALGERDMITKVGSIEVWAHEDRPSPHRIPFTELPEAFDAVWRMKAEGGGPE